MKVEKAMAPHSSTLAWKIPWTEEPSRLQSMGSLRVRHNWVTSLSLFTFHFHALEKEMATHSSVLAWRIPGMGEPGGLPSMGSHRVGYDWSELAAAAWPVQVDEWQNPSQYCKVITPQLKINIKNSNHVTQKNIYGIRKKLKLSTILKSLMEKINFPTKLSQLT